MRIIVMSDSHSAYGRVLDIVTKNQTADLFIHLGDGEDEYDRIAAKFPEKKFLGVRGNNDWHSEKPPYLFLDLDGVKIFCTHGDMYSVKFGLERIIREGVKREADVVLYGHTHVARKDYIDGRFILNPGSVADSSMTPAGYMVLDITSAGIVPVFRQVEPSPEEY